MHQEREHVVLSSLEFQFPYHMFVGIQTELSSADQDSTPLALTARLEAKFVNYQEERSSYSDVAAQIATIEWEKSWRG